MANETLKYDVGKSIVGGIRNDSTPTTYNEEPASLRMNSESAVVVSIGGSTGTEIATNTIADDTDATAQTWANVTDVTGVQYYPTAAGYEIENRSNFSFHIRMRDGKFDVQVSNDSSNWVTATRTVVDISQGGNGYDNTHYIEADVQVDDFGLAWEKCEFRYIRIMFTPNNSTNTFVALVRARSH